jgi:peptidyl-prolyl cis-trans isomerase SurA
MKSVGWLHLLAWTLACAAARADFKISNGIAAVADDTVITRQEVYQVAAPNLDLYQRTYFNDREALEQKSIGALTEALEQLIDRQLVLHDFKTLGGIIQESYIDDLIKDRIREQFGDRVTFARTLQAEGITYETFRQRERDKLIMSIMERKNVREGLLISPAKIERYYQTNLYRYKLEDQVKLRKIELNLSATESVDDVRRRAFDIKAKIDGGIPFAEMASTYSESADRKDGGLWGWKEEKKMAKGLAEVAFVLKPHECSPVLAFARDSDEGYWVYRYGAAGNVVLGRKFTDNDVFVEERKFEEQPGHAHLPAPPRTIYLLQVDEKQVAHTRPLPEVRDEIEKDLLLQERARLQKKWIDRLRQKSYYRMFN